MEMSNVEYVLGADAELSRVAAVDRSCWICRMDEERRGGWVRR